MRVCAALAGLLEVAAFRQMAADIDADREDRDAREERQPPAPRAECVVRQRLRGEKRGRRQHEAAADAELAPRRVITALLGRRVLADHQHAAAPFAAGRDALQQAQHDERGRRPQADLRIGRQQADREGRRAHDQQCPDERRLAPVAIADVAEHDPAERPRDEAERECRECGEAAGERRCAGREEHVAEHQRRGRAIHEEVVPLHRVAGDGGDDDPAQLPVGERPDGARGLHGVGRVHGGTLKGEAGACRLVRHCGLVLSAPPAPVKSAEKGECHHSRK